MSKTYDLVRNGAALFDFSADGCFFVSGREAVAAIDAVIAADLDGVAQFKALNTLILDETGAVVAILWVLKDEAGVWVLCDADRQTAVAEQLAVGSAGRDARVADRGETTACYAIVGPAAQEIAMAVAGEDVIGIPYLGFEPNPQTDALVARLGYTGEFEYRFLVDRERAGDLRQRLLEAGAAYALEAGDIQDLPLLMLEMRSLSQAAHIPAGIGPIQAGLHWMVNFRKEAFPGYAAVHEQKTDPGRKAVILLLETAEIPAGDGCVRLEGQGVGECIAAVYSPTLGKSIALAYVDAEVAWVGVSFDVGGGEARAVSAPLFITKTVRAAR